MSRRNENRKYYNEDEYTVSFEDLSKIVQMLKKIKQTDKIRNDPELLAEIDWFIMRMIQDSEGLSSGIDPPKQQALTDLNKWINEYSDYGRKRQHSIAIKNTMQNMKVRMSNITASDRQDMFNL